MLRECRPQTIIRDMTLAGFILIASCIVTAITDLIVGSQYGVDYTVSRIQQ